MSQDSADTQCLQGESASMTLLILLMRMPQPRLESILFNQNRKVLNELLAAFKQVPADFLEESLQQINQFRQKVNKLIMQHQKNSNKEKMDKLRSAMGCLKKIRKQ